MSNQKLAAPKVAVRDSLSYIKDYGIKLLEGIVEATKPRHTPGDLTRKVGTFRDPIGRQVDVVEATVKHLFDDDQRSIILDVEMSGGKTYMALRIIQAMREWLPKRPQPGRMPGWKANGRYNILFVCPTISVEKVIRETELTLPQVRIVNLTCGSAVNKLREELARQAANPAAETVMFVLGITRIRMHHDTEPYFMTATRERLNQERAAANPARWPEEWKNPPVRCPSCGQYIKVRKGGKTKEVVEKTAADQEKEDKKIEVPLTAQELIRRGIKTCPNKRYPKSTNKEDEGKLCGAPLVKIVDNKNRRYFSVAKYIHKHLKGAFDLAVIDELHNARNDSLQGQMMTYCAQAAEKVVGMTGTLVGGLPTQLWNICWGLNPRSMVNAGFSHKSEDRFARTYGASEIRISKSAKGGKKKKISLKKGMSTKIYGDILASWTISMQLLEIAENMVPYTEELRPIRLAPEMAQLDADIQKAIKDEIAEARKAGFSYFNHLLGRMLHARLAGVDSLAEDLVDDVLERKDDFGNVVETRQVSIKIPPINLPISPKEEELVQDALHEKANGRKMLVYIAYTGQRDCSPRIVAALEGAGLKVAVLRSSTVASEKREEWIRKTAPGIDVLLCHPGLVKEALDLIEFPTICLYQPCIFDIYLIRQACRRSWRLTQTKPVRMLFYYYEGCYQEHSMREIATAIDTALIASGITTESEIFDLSSYGEGSIIRNLVANLEQAIESGEVSSAKLQIKTPKINGGAEALMAVSAAEVIANGGKLVIEQPDGDIEVSAVPAVAEDGSVQMIFISRRVKKGRKTVLVTEEVEVDKLAQIGERHDEVQLCLF